MTYLGSGDLAPNDFLQLIQMCSLPEQSLLMAFSPVEARFVPFAYDGEFLTETEEGRIFSSSGELKWRRLDTFIRVVYLGEDPLPAGLADWSRELVGLSSCTRQFLLWGERTDTEPEWLEQQVPHRFCYPIETALFRRGRAALVVEDWTDRAGIPRFSRYRGIIEVEGGK
ncbi:MAG: CRISPR-associated protein Csx19 [Pseudomonadota bacterium]